MNSAFDEKDWEINKKEANCVKVIEESGCGSRIIVPCEYYGLQEKGYFPWSQGKVDLRNSYGSFHRDGLYFTIQYGLPKDTLIAYILDDNMDEDYNKLPGYGDTLATIILYRKYE